MKKILNLLASVTLITSGASTVVACGSSHTPPPPKPPTPKSEVQKLYNELNETATPFLIENNNFWGNEARYQQDLLKDLEQSAQIPKKYDNLLSLFDKTPTLIKQGIQTVKVNISDGVEKMQALVNIDWKLTAAQKKIYQFYTQTWPEKISDAYDWSNKNLLLYGYYNNWDDQIGWWDPTPGNQLPWDVSFSNGLVSNLKLILGNQIPELNDYQIGSDVPQTKTIFNINQLTNLPKSALYIESDGVKFPLLYYPHFNVGDPLPNPENWQFMYQTEENSIHQLKNPNNVWDIARGAMNPNTNSASNPRNTGLILSELENSQYGPFTDKMTFKGNIRTDGKPGKIKVLYGKNHVDINTYMWVKTY